MGRRQDEHLETNKFLARRDDQIPSSDARLHQTITHLSLVRARLLSTLDQLDALQREHTASLAAAAREQRSLEAKLRAAEEVARKGEADRMDMRDAVGMLVNRVEATPDFRNWPRSQIHLPSLSEPSRLSPTHQRRNNKPPSNVNPSSHSAIIHTINLTTNDPSSRKTDDENPVAEQLAYASALISHFRGERDAAFVRAEHSDARVLELEARLARRDVELEACTCATKVTRTSVSAQTRLRHEGRSVSEYTAFPSRRNETPTFEADPDPELDDILDISLDRNRELEREVKELSSRLDRAHVSQEAQVRKGAVSHYPHAHEEGYERDPEQPSREASHVHIHRASLRSRTPTPARPLQRQQERADASLLSSLSFSPSSTATSSAAAWTETGSSTPRQHEYQQQHQTDYPAVMYDDEYADARSSTTYEDEAEDGEDGDESMTQPVDVDEPIHHVDHEYDHGYDQNHINDHHLHEYDIMKSVPVPIPSLHALHRQVALLGEKIDAFAAERRRAAAGAKMDHAGHPQSEVEAFNLMQSYDDDDGRGTQSVPLRPRADGGRNYTTRGRIQDADEDDRRNSNSGGRDLDTRRATYGEVEKAATQSRATLIPHNATVDVIGVNTEDDGSRYTRLPPLQPPPLPLPLPQSLSTLLPQLTPPPLPHADDEEPHHVYDHPHETCEATLLAARKREMELVTRVRALEGALAVVEAQVRHRMDKDAEAAIALEWGANGSGSGIGGDVSERGGVSIQSTSIVQALPAQEDETEARWVDTAVQTLTSPPPPPPPPPLLTPAPVGDLLDLDVSELHIVVEKTKRVEDERKGERAREAEEDANIDYGEMPMEIATPLSTNVIPLVPDVDVDADPEGDLDASAYSHGREGSERVHGPASESGSSVEEEPDARHDVDGPASLREVLQSPASNEEPPAANASLLLEPANAESPDDPPRFSDRPASSPPPTHDSPSHHPVSLPPLLDAPSQPSSTGTSPTIAVGLLPPLLLQEHLSLPATLLHRSHHTSSSSSALSLFPDPRSQLRRAHTDSDIGTNVHTQLSGSAHRFALYRATSSFVAELRQAESQLAVTAAQVEAQSMVAGDEDLAPPILPNAEAGTEEEQRNLDERPPLAPSEVPEYTIFY